VTGQGIRGAGPGSRSRFDPRAIHPAQGRPVLYVSGGPDARIHFMLIARRWEMVRLLVAESGEEGLDVAVARHPRMVVLDSDLSDMDWDNCHRLARKGHGARCAHRGPRP
jgi:hypothetical protein